MEPAQKPSGPRKTEKILEKSYDIIGKTSREVV
jgi:hypothetical protein